MRLIHVQHMETLYPHLFMEDLVGDLYDLWFYKETRPPFLNNDTSFQYLLGQVLAGVQYLYIKNITHGRIRPDNIFLKKFPGSQDPMIKIRFVIGGFGLSTIDSRASSDNVAPEILQGEKPGLGADIYSVGATVLSLLGSLPDSRDYYEDTSVPPAKWYNDVRTRGEIKAEKLGQMISGRPKDRMTVEQCILWCETGGSGLFKDLQQQQETHWGQSGQSRQSRQSRQSGQSEPPAPVTRPSANTNPQRGVQQNLASNTGGHPSITAGPTRRDNNNNNNNNAPGHHTNI